MKKVAGSLIAALFLASAAPALAGPPFLTDDPQPVDYGHFETYVFTQADNDNTANVHNVSGPALEFNWGVLPNTQLHIIAPYARTTPSGSPSNSGFGDMEVGIKFRFVQETRTTPMIGIFPAAELATGDASRGLGNGRTWYRLPVWIQKSWGPWTTYGGGGVALNNAPGAQNYVFAGWLIQGELSKQFTLGTELYTQGPAALGNLGTTIFNAGGYYNPTEQLSVLFSVGHSIAGQQHAISYFGVYYTFPHPAAEETQ